MRKLSILFLFSLVLSFTSCNEYPDLEDGLYAEFVTNKGTFVAELYFEQTPITVASFVSLAEGNSTRVSEEYKGKPFYNGLIFHRVIKDFMIQGGDPTGTGSGGPGYQFPNETSDSLTHSSKGILSMANSGPDTNGSQFFITLKETPWLDGMHTVFGKVVEGQEVVDSIGVVETSGADKPVEDVVINEVNIIRKGSAAKNFDGNKIFEEELKNNEAKAAEEERKQGELMAAKAQQLDSLKAGAQELPSGLKIAVTEEGTGPTPNAGDIVMVHYAGFLPNGKLFDTSIESIAQEMGTFDQRRKDMNGYGPIQMSYSPDAQMIAGFKEGVQTMNVGDKATLFIPAHLGYGERGAGGVIPPNSDLIFQVELVEIQE